jgi:protein-S-isoprenylcysteine O-methyltransferase Ste14
MPSIIKLAVYLSYMFLLSELILMLAKRSKIKSVKRRGDKGSLVVLWVAISLFLPLGFGLARYGEWSSENYITGTIGILLSVSGLILRWATILQLKKAFTVDVAISNIQQLKTDGLFKIIRHPSYLGLLMIIGGFALMMNSLLSIIIVTVPVFAAIQYRIYIEEDVLRTEFGEVYQDYQKNTKKIIPFIY